MSDWNESAIRRRDYRNTKVPDVTPRHRKKTKRPKNFGIAKYWLRWRDRRPWIVWYETARQRDQAYAELIRNKRSYSLISAWRCDRDDYVWVQSFTRSTDNDHD